MHTDKVGNGMTTTAGCTICVLCNTGNKASKQSSNITANLASHFTGTTESRKRNGRKGES